MRVKFWKKVSNADSGGGEPAKLLQQVRNVAESTVRKFSELVRYGLSHDDARDLNKVFGWATSEKRDFEFYWELYRYQDLARRVVNILARSCWRSGADLKKEQDSKEILLESEMKILKKAGLFTGLESADILNRVGSFSVLYVGIPTTKEDENLNEPVSKNAGPKDLSEVFFSPYSEKAITVNSYDQDPKSSRYGKPLIYTLSPGQTDVSTKIAQTAQPFQVHWSRVVHMAEGSLDGGITGMSELEDIANRLTDLQKILGGSAESFYRNAHPKFTMDVDKDTKVTATDLDNLQTNTEEWLNEWKTFVGLSGAKIKQVMSRQIDPSSAVKVQVQMISGAKGIPIRILTGEGAGQLAGNEDKVSYNQLNSDRQTQVCENWLVRTLEIIEGAGILKLPEDFIVSWPISEALDEKTKSEVDLNEARAAESISRALQAYSAAPGIENIIPSVAFMSLVLKMNIDEIKEVSKQLSTLGKLGDGEDPESATE